MDRSCTGRKNSPDVDGRTDVPPSDSPAPVGDTWLEVIGTYTSPRAPAGQLDLVPALEVQTLCEVPAPADPYED